MSSASCLHLGVMGIEERYPLEAAVTLREAEVSAARDTLSARASALQDAVKARGEAGDALASHRAASAVLSAREAQRDAEGRNAGDLLRSRTYQERRAREERALLEAVADREREVRRAEAEVEGAREALGAARAAREAVERHRERWDRARRRRDERRAEAETDDLTGARHHRRGPGEP